MEVSIITENQDAFDIEVSAIKMIDAMNNGHRGG